tara:strand:+ start:132 stop:503 length:372 start_codon:yes stop_codon:yes gene_type:complete
MRKNLSLEKIKEERKKSRIEKISSLIKKTIAEILLTIDFVDSNGKNIIVFVSNVILSSDGKSVKVLLETLNYKAELTNTIIEKINENSTKVKKEFSKRIELRYTPKLQFEIIHSQSFRGNDES